MSLQIAWPGGGLGLCMAAATGAVNLALAGVALLGGCRRYGDLLHGLCLHAGLVGCLHAGLVTSLHSLLLSADRQLDQPVWRICCKVYLFCRLFLPALYLYLIAAITVCFRSIRYPPRRCGQSCTRLGYLTAHCLPWAACSLGLLPVLLMHKESTETALRNEGRCLMIERWAWLGPLSILLAAPLLVDLALTCLLCAYKPYRDDDGGGGGDTCDSSDTEDGDEKDDECGFDGNEHGDNNEGQRSGRRRRRHRRQKQRQQHHSQQLQLRSCPTQSNGFGASSSAVTVVDGGIVERGGGGGGVRGYYRCEARLLSGRPMRIARTALLTLSLLQAATQLPHCATSMLQTVLRNLPSRQPIQQSAVDAVYWLHLLYFPLAGTLLTVFTLQLRRAFRITEAEIGNELARCRHQRAAAGEVLQTTSMLTSL